MLMTKCFVQNHVLISVLPVTALPPVAMEAASESDRLERLERAVQQLQKRNAELEAEVSEPKTANCPCTGHSKPWSDFRDANPEFGDDQFDEVIGRMQLMF